MLSALDARDRHPEIGIALASEPALLLIDEVFDDFPRLRESVMLVDEPTEGPAQRFLEV